MSVTRELQQVLLDILKRGKSIIILGPRQTGKTTLVKSIKHDRYINFMLLEHKLRYESNPGLLYQEILALKQSLNTKPRIIIDEVQKIPEITNDLQVLIDDKIAEFIITGSSAKKITNLLPGRVIKLNMQPLSLKELGSINVTLEQLLVYGSLPGVITLNDDAIKTQELNSYVNLYLEEEIRKEALVRNLAAFSNFLQLASIESGNILSFTDISQQLGVSHSTIASYYQILLESMLGFKVEPLTITNTRRKLTKSAKYFIFDLGIRKAAAKDSDNPSYKQLSLLFEQFIAIELHKIIQMQSSKNLRLLFWRSHSGPEVDFIIQSNDVYIAIEVKYKKVPTLKDAKHLMIFNQEYKTKKSYIVCNTPYPVQLVDDILAINWRQLANIFAEF